MLKVAVTNEQQGLVIDAKRLRTAVKAVLSGEGIGDGEISLAIVDDPTIHELNRKWLAHDEPTDVLSFVLEEGEGYVEGEIIVSADTARARAGEFGWTADEELLLYVVHGSLHLAGYDDKDPADREVMREREEHYLRVQAKGSGFGVQGSGG